MKIGELTKATSAQKEVIRNYGLELQMRSAIRRESNYRIYDSSHIEHLALILRCRCLDVER